MEKYKNISILYEDNHLLVVNKPAGMPVCPDSTHDKDLLTTLKEYLKNKYLKPGNVYLGLVHRLDRPVSGIMVFAKTSKAAERLTKQIHCGTFKKVYYAVIYGKLKDKGTFTDYLIKDESTNTSYVTTSEIGKLSTLDYTTIKTVDDLSLVKINLHTGRHHQIRVQFASRHTPLYGDHKYNPNVKKTDLSDIALIAKSLTFNHPTTKEPLTFDIDLPSKHPWTLFKD